MEELNNVTTDIDLSAIEALDVDTVEGTELSDTAKYGLIAGVGVAVGVAATKLFGWIKKKRAKGEIRIPIIDKKKADFDKDFDYPDAEDFDDDITVDGVDD